MNTLVLPCVNCRRPLPPPPWVSLSENGFRLDDVATCDLCLIRYSGELLRTMHPEVWAYVALNRLHCFECGDRFTPVVHAENGQPIACPTHGPAPSLSHE